MGIIRTVGLLFMMTILVGGCIAAVGTAPPPDPVAYHSDLITWEEAVKVLNQGQVTRVIQMQNQVVYLYLSNGTRLITTAPDFSALYEEIVRCGNLCNGLQAANA